MKKLVLTLLFIGTVSLYSQGMEQISWVAKFGAAGGFSPIYVMPDLSPINNYTKQLGISSLAEKGFITWGGGGYAYVMIIPNLRIGGIGFGGTTVENNIANGIKNEASYSIGAGGVTVEYTLPFISNIAVSVGALIGGGSAELKLYRNKGLATWDGIWDDVSTLNGDKDFESHILKNEFFTFSPTLNVDIPLSRFVAFRLGVGYLASFSSDWRVDNDVQISNVPNDLNSSSFFVQTGLYFGFFAF